MTEVLKPDFAAARTFLERWCFLKDGAVTFLGAFVCANHPGDQLSFRSRVHGYMDVPQQIAQDKQVIIALKPGAHIAIRNPGRSALLKS